MSFLGNELKQRNEQIIQCLSQLKSQRNDLQFLIEKQQEEKMRLQTEVQRITYKLSLLNKSLAQRVTTMSDYERTIQKAEESYIKLVETSGLLLNSVKREAGQLEQIMDKKIGTESSTSVANRSQKDDMSDSVRETIISKTSRVTNSHTSAAERSLNELDFEIV